MPQVLCVDDEPQVLEGLTLQLRKECQVITAESGQEGLEVLQEQGPFAVVISDMRMPRMDGAEFLGNVCEVSPDTTRMLLTGNADVSAAVAAVNQGQIFRFLTKPCPPQDLREAVRAAIEQYDLVTAERVLLHETLLGSIKALSEILYLTNPVVFGKAGRIGALAMGIANYLRLSDTWALEAAATLRQLGFVSLPDEVARKHATSQPLRPDEAAMVAQVPSVTDSLLARIPRLEPVREILALAAAGRSSGETATAVMADILRLATDWDAIESTAAPLETMLNQMRRRADAYQDDVLQAFFAVKGSKPDRVEIREVAVQELVEGMVLVDDVLTTKGQLLLARGHVVTSGLLARLRNLPAQTIQQPIRAATGAGGSHRLEGKDLAQPSTPGP